MHAEKNRGLRGSLQVKVESHQGCYNYEQCLRVLHQTVYGGCQVHAEKNLGPRGRVQVKVELQQRYYNSQRCLRGFLQTV